MSATEASQRATLHVTVLGVDGSGKSTLVEALPQLLAGEMGVVAGGAGDEFRIVAPDEDRLGPGFAPMGLPASARLASRFRRLAKKWVDRRKVYPLFKVLQMMFQDAAARRIGRRHGAQILLSDGNTLLSTAGRAANYRRPASTGEPGGAPEPADLAEAFRFVLDGTPPAEATSKRLSPLGGARIAARALRALGGPAIWLPDLVLFLDLPPEKALSRITARGKKIDRHENLADLTQAREMYLRTLGAFEACRGEGTAIVVNVADAGPGETLALAIAALRPHLEARGIAAAGGSPLGTTEELSSRSFWGKVLNPRYLFYLVAHALRDAWREPAFLLSWRGRKFLKEGYSGGVMRVIYDQDDARGNPFERIFLDYPLHRGVYDRLQILAHRIEPELSARLAAGRDLAIFTAPSGYAYDIFRPLEAIARSDPAPLRRVRLVAADLDPHGELESALTTRAAALGLSFTFLRGDLGSDAMRARFAESAPFDMALFVGLSSWLPKPLTLRHLRWLRSHLRDDGLLVTDCFTPASYSLSGRYAGYKAHYYTPRCYALLIEACGFDGLGAVVESGRDRINHVFLARPREGRAAGA